MWNSSITLSHLLSPLKYCNSLPIAKEVVWPSGSFESEAGEEGVIIQNLIKLATDTPSSALAPTPANPLTSKPDGALNL